MKDLTIAKKLMTPSARVEQDRVIPFSEFMMFVYYSRDDVYETFDLKTRHGRMGFMNWCFKFGYERYFERAVNPDVGFSKPCGGFGVNLIGYARGELGIGEDSRMTSRALVEANIPIEIFSVDPGSGITNSHAYLEEYSGTSLKHHVNLFNLPGMSQLGLVSKFGTEMFENRYNICFWPWELEKWPRELDLCLNINDEIWAISEFTKTALERNSKTPIQVMPQTVEIPEVKPKDLTAFGIKKGTCVFSFVFDSNSYPPRKNPTGLVKAFKNAFQDNENVALILKTMWAKKDSSHWKDLEAVIEKDSRIVIIDELYSKEDTLGLIAATDCFVSLHRGEGFGRAIAEAMLLEKPCIVTNYSGNMDFCTTENSLLVDSRRIKVHRHEYPYVLEEENFWADPDLDSAATQMRLIYKNESLRIELGRKARQTILSRYSPNVTSKIYQRRILEVYNSLKARHPDLQVPC